MNELSSAILREMISRTLPDLSNVKPPTTTAAEKMATNLRAASGTKADKSPELAEYWRNLLKGVFD